MILFTGTGDGPHPRPGRSGTPVGTANGTPPLGGCHGSNPALPRERGVPIPAQADPRGSLAAAPRGRGRARFMRAIHVCVSREPFYLSRLS